MPYTTIENIYCPLVDGSENPTNITPPVHSIYVDPDGAQGVTEETYVPLNLDIVANPQTDGILIGPWFLLGSYGQRNYNRAYLYGTLHVPEPEWPEQGDVGIGPLTLTIYYQTQVAQIPPTAGDGKPVNFSAAPGGCALYYVWSPTGGIIGGMSQTATGAFIEEATLTIPNFSLTRGETNRRINFYFEVWGPYTHYLLLYASGRWSPTIWTPEPPVNLAGVGYPDPPRRTFVSGLVSPGSSSFT